ncbi:Nucleotide-binding universal stress protein, UspA family [Halogranum amylolyticum]|uniref:Nucleotide-binding universal stress protein, UspA family n=1 Tax=Halogranum amylolyticum TaxID=660520 RepID=A0A1H8UVM2_9EURY|nr:universal stress protein [Halogranum amylolyticum]SEP06618.1 Nucleotide-binding universal stress protein, UspA family [Halogranum amylolyticum]
MTAILLATDSSTYAKAAARRAIDLAAERGQPLYVLAVVDSRKFDEPALSTEELATIEAEDHGHQSVGAVVELATAAGVDVDYDIRHGVPHETILQCASQLGADCIVVGAHGEHENHLGGVGRQVADEADCEVVVVDTTD